MADDPANIQAAFNGQLTFAVAYGFTTPDQILDFINNVADHRDPRRQYGIVPEWFPHLKDIRDGIEYLYRSGAGYPRPTPPQHIRRTAVNHNTDRLRINQYFFRNRHRVFSVYDLLAMFLSLALAPVGATRATFYYPWTFIYIRWSTIMTHFNGTNGFGGKTPTMYQCTWIREPNQQSRFFIGTVLAGMVRTWQPAPPPGQARPPNPWIERLRRARFSHLTNDRNENGAVGRRWAYGQSPEFDAKGVNGWNFGNCAETHPFVELVRDARADVRGRCYGFAVKPQAVFGNEPLPNLEAALAIQYTRLHFTKMSLPCLNCKAMING
ncbi:hypothetical protein MW887_000699 [Aspergillus wentii]|nr:hypothetical protein MW887_000699 [Aspergillus wentii]